MTRLKELKTLFLPQPKHAEYLGKTVESAKNLPVVTNIDAGLQFDGSGNHEGYVLTIDEHQISISASGPAGIFYGRQTLKQIISQAEGPQECMRVHDYPDIAMRGVSIDFRFQTFKMDYFIEKVRSWAGYKINTLMIDYGDNFPFSGKYAAVRGTNAFTEEEIERLMRCCKDNFIEIIPCVQSFGHMEYILKKPGFSHLAENDRCSQICPLNPDALVAVKELLTQAYIAHGQPKYLSIGGDEAMHLGKCSRCQEYAEKHGKRQLYIHFTNQVIAFVKELGAKPIIYADMLLADPGMLSGLDECVLGDWDYWTQDYPPNKLMEWDSKKNISPDDAGNIEHLATIANDLVDKDGQAFHPFAYTRWLAKTREGEVIGLPSTASTGPDDNWTPNYNVHIPNIRGFAAVVKLYGAVGMITTVWERYFMECISYGIVCGAEETWNQGQYEADRAKRFAALHFGLSEDCDDLVQAMFKLSAPYTLVEKKWPRVYIPDVFGRGDITLGEIVANNDIDENINSAQKIFNKYLSKATSNRYELEQWLFGVSVKKFWRKVAAFEHAVNTGQDPNHAIHESIKPEYEQLKKDAWVLLQGTMPVQSMETRISDAFSNFTGEKLSQ